MTSAPASGWTPKFSPTRAHYLEQLPEHSMQSITVLKIGGRAASDSRMIMELGRELRTLSAGEATSPTTPAAPGKSPRVAAATDSFVVVHGGGSELSALMERYGYTPRFVDGVRSTSEEEMPLVDMALAGKMNTALVRLLGSVGLNPVGLSAQDGGMVTGKPVVMADGTGSRTGTPVAADGALLRRLLQAGYTPVVSPVSRDETWNGLNINADEIALAVAQALEAKGLIFFSDIPGILDGDRVIDRLTIPQAREAIESGVISGGMIPKVRSSLAALEGGVGSIIIGEYKEPGDLGALAAGRKGTVLLHE